jgi:N-hydroxyarylamine O-acetyltransferase
VAARAVFDIDAYLERIGLSGRPQLHELHAAHVVSIPFENLDPYRGVHVSVAPEDVERKLVGAGRGGYCYEQNLLLQGALQALGYDAELMLARVRVGGEPGAVRPRSHLLLRVRDSQGGEWHADVGFGRGTLMEPIPFGPGGPYDQAGWSVRVIAEGDELILQAEDREGWADQYSFDPRPVPHVDVVTSNWYTSTNPRSPFVSGLMVAANAADGTRTALSDWGEPLLEVETPASREATHVQREQFPALLAERFGLPGWELGPDERLRPAAS